MVDGKVREKGGVWLYKGCMRDPCDGTALLFHCINVNILVVILYYLYFFNISSYIVLYFIKHYCATLL